MIDSSVFIAHLLPVSSAINSLHTAVICVPLLGNRFPATGCLQPHPGDAVTIVESNCSGSNIVQKCLCLSKTDRLDIYGVFSPIKRGFLTYLLSQSTYVGCFSHRTTFFSCLCTSNKLKTKIHAMIKIRLFHTVYRAVALYGMPALTSYEEAVSPSVCQTRGL